MHNRKTENNMRRFGYSLLLLVVVGILAGGCSTRWPTTVDFTSNGKGPLSSIRPLTVLVQVEDQRPSADQDSVLQLKALVGSTDTWYTKKPVPLIVRDALMSQLSKCGHQAVTDTSIKVDARVKIVLKRFIATFSKSGSAEAQVDAEVFVTNEAKKATTDPFQISGNYQRKAGLVGPVRKGPDEDLSAALAEFIHNLTFDSRLVEGLQ
jgi:hypothetical protein